MGNGQQIIERRVDLLLQSQPGAGGAAVKLFDQRRQLRILRHPAQHRLQKLLRQVVNVVDAHIGHGARRQQFWRRRSSGCAGDNAVNVSPMHAIKPDAHILKLRWPPTTRCPLFEKTFTRLLMEEVPGGWDCRAIVHVPRSFAHSFSAQRNPLPNCGRKEYSHSFSRFNAAHRGLPPIPAGVSWFPAGRPATRRQLNRRTARPKTATYSESDRSSWGRWDLLGNAI